MDTVKDKDATDPKDPKNAKDTRPLNARQQARIATQSAAQTATRVRVVALEPGFYDNGYRKTGDVFIITLRPDEPLPEWVEEESAHAARRQHERAAELLAPKAPDTLSGIAAATPGTAREQMAALGAAPGAGAVPVFPTTGRA